MAFLFAAQKSRFASSSTTLSKPGLAGFEVMRRLRPPQRYTMSSTCSLTEPEFERTNALESVASRSLRI